MWGSGGSEGEGEDEGGENEGKGGEGKEMHFLYGGWVSLGELNGTEGEEGPVAVGLRVACALQKVNDVQVFMGLLARQFTLQGYEDEGRSSSGSLVVGYAFVWLE